MKETGSYLLDVLFMGGLITASLCDFKKRKIPDAITGFLFLTGVAALFWMPQPSIKMRLAGAFIAGLPLFAAAVCRPGAVGGGDVKLMAAGGFFLGLSAVWDSLAFGMALAGFGCVLLGGCPLRQLVLAGEGNTDSAITVFGLMAGAAVAHNFGLASSGEGPTANGKIAVVIGFVVLIVIATVNSMRKNEA